MKRNIAGFILSGLMVVLLTTCGEKHEGPPETITLDGVTYTVIVEESDFQKMRDDPTGNYYLWRDVALTGDFEPIAPDTDTNEGNFQGDPFTGIFEGNNKTISNLRIVKPGEEYVGLFGQIGADGAFDPVNGVVQNLTLVLAAGTKSNPSIEGVKGVGALAGRSYGKIEAVGVEGGFVKGGDDYVGGLVGATYGTITSSYATGSVKGTSDVGGLVGYAWDCSITSSYATGSVSGDFFHVGGLVGVALYNSSIISSYATGSVKGTNTVGGLVGQEDGDSSITSSYATGSITLTGTDDAGGLVGNFAGGTINSSYFDASSTIMVNGVAQSSLPGIGSGTSSGVTGYDSSSGSVQDNGTDVTQSNFSTWDFNTVWRWVADGQWPLLAWQ